MNGKPSAAQKKFHDWCINERKCVLTEGQASLHHIKGARMKLKLVSGFAGEWYVLPVCYWWHQDLKNTSAIHTNKKRFEDRWAVTQKELWLHLMAVYKDEFGEYPMSPEEYQIIKDRA